MKVMSSMNLNLMTCLPNVLNYLSKYFYYNL